MNMNLTLVHKNGSTYFRCFMPELGRSDLALCIEGIGAVNPDAASSSVINVLARSKSPKKKGWVKVRNAYPALGISRMLVKNKRFTFSWGLGALNHLNLLPETFWVKVDVIA